MNLLIDTLPDTVEVCGRDYEIHTSFRDCLRVMIACEDDELTPQEKYAVILANMFDKVPPDAEEALDKTRCFLDGGKDYDGDGQSAPTSNMRLFSFEKDARLIYAAFRQTHGIDLSTADLHWWQFLALFMDLGQDTAFCQLVSLRSRIKKGKATKEERQMASEMGDMINIPDLDNRTIEEREAEAEFLRLVGKHAPSKT